MSSSRFSMALTWHFIFFLLVHGAGEGISEGDGSEEHLDADDKVLPARCHRTSADLLSIDEERVGYDPAAFQDGEDHSYKSIDIFSITSSYNSYTSGTSREVNLPCQKDKKMTDLIVRNLSTGSYGLSRSLVAKKKRKRA